MSTTSLLLSSDLQASISSNSMFWGGLSGNFVITNSGQQSKSNWSFSFVSTYSRFDFWNADESAVRNSDGTYTITVQAATGAAPLAAGASLDLGFTVSSDSDATVTLSEAVLGAVGTSGGGSTAGNTSPGSTDSTSSSTGSTSVTNTNTNTTNTQISGGTTTSGGTTATGGTTANGLVVEIQLGGSWSGAYEGTITVRNASSSAIAAGWSVSFLSDHALGSVSDFQMQQQLQADGRTRVTLSAPSWAANQGVAAGASLSSYFQARGDRGSQSVAELFTFTTADSGSSGTTSSTGTTGSTDTSSTGTTGSTGTGTGSTGTTDSTGSTGTDATSGNTAPPISGPTGLNSGNAGDARWGEAYFAPYVDMALWPVPDLSAIATSRGTSLLTLGFLQASGNGQLGWGGLDALAITPTNSNEQAQAIRASIQAFQKAGGDVMVSLGGMNGTSLAQFGARNGMSAATLAARYGEVVSQFQLQRLDFDIEGAALADTPATALHSQALALLQQQNPHLEIWYTLPVLPSGLTGDGLAVVRSALAAGVKLDGVNVMAMDYGESAAPTSGPNAKSMGAYAIQAAEASKNQLQTLFAGFNQGFGWNMVGVTPMIGVNDISSEVFTLADAQLLEDFARSKGLGMLSMWSIARDNPGNLGQASATASGLNAAAGSFSAIFHDYGSQNSLSFSGTSGTSGSTTGTTETTGGTGSTGSTGSTTGSTGGSGTASDLTTDNDISGPLPSGSAANRVVGYFEEWGIYGRDFRVADVHADQLTHLNYSFFGITPTQSDLPFMAKELNVLPGAMVQAGYLGLNSNTPGGIGIHDTWAAYEKTFSQADQLVSRRFDAGQWQGLSESRRQAYLSGGEFDVISQADGSRLVRAKADTWNDSQGGMQRLFTKADWDGLSATRQAYLVEHSPQYSWTDQWQGSFTPGSGTTSERIAAVNRHFAAGTGRTLTLRADGDLLRDANAWVGDDPANWQKLYAGNLNQLRLLKELNPELSIGFAVGGWTLSGNFSTNLDDAAGREIFTQSIVDHLRYYDFFSTVDFDWEYPGGGGLESNASNPQDGSNFALTLQLLDQKLAAFKEQTGREIELSVATAGGAEKLAKLNLQGIDQYVDFYNVMTYDFHGGWEKTTGHQAAMRGDSGGYDVVTAIDQFRQAGIAMDKVVLGAPAYTRAWGGVAAGSSYGYGMAGDASLAAGSFEKGNYDQKDLITGIENNSYALVWDDNNKAAFAYNAAGGIWSSVETAATIAGKAAYVQQAGLGGMMFWALSNDSSGPQSLVGAAHDALRGGVTLDTIAGRAPSFDAVVGGDGQFRFSDFSALA